MLRPTSSALIFLCWLLLPGWFVTKHPIPPARVTASPKGLKVEAIDASDRIRYTLTFDRPDYVEGEGIFADWCLTNIGKTDLWLINFRGGEPSLQGNDGQGNTVALYDPSNYCGAGVVITIWKPGQSLHGWVDLRDRCFGWRGPRDYRLRASTGVVILTGPEQGEELGVTTEVFSLVLARSIGADAVALGYITEECRRFAEDGYLEYQGGVFWGPVADRILKETQSARFKATAAFYQGRRTMRYLEPGVQRDADTLDTPRSYFNHCAESEASSPYLKGLARWHLLQLKMQEPGSAARREAVRMAQALRVDNPGSYLDDQARQALEEMLPDIH